MNRPFKKFTEYEIDEIVPAEADDASAWEKPIGVSQSLNDDDLNEDVLVRLPDSVRKIVSASAEAELLAHCARLEIEPARAERVRALVGSNPAGTNPTGSRAGGSNSAGSTLDWSRLFALAQRHALLPLLYFQLNRVAADLVPPPQLKQLRERSQSNAALNVLLAGEMVRLLELFEANQIPAVPYKGPAIGVGIYGNLALRQFADLDILVPDADVWKATELLIAEGYRAHFTIPPRKQSSFIRLGYVRLFNHETALSPTSNS